MLSKNAFNALLKTLEEPPKHAKFILATTELNKIPFTILSRCMHFDLKRISLNKIIFLSTNILEKEKIFFDPQCMKYISIDSEGSARDALSLLEKLILASKKNHH